MKHVEDVVATASVILWIVGWIGFALVTFLVIAEGAR
jgi:hypothetical protein